MTPGFALGGCLLEFVKEFFHNLIKLNTRSLFRDHLIQIQHRVGRYGQSGPLGRHIHTV